MSESALVGSLLGQCSDVGCVVGSTKMMITGILLSVGESAINIICMKEHIIGTDVSYIRNHNRSNAGITHNGIIIVIINRGKKITYVSG